MGMVDPLTPGEWDVLEGLRVVLEVGLLFLA